MRINVEVDLYMWPRIPLNVAMRNLPRAKGFIVHGT